MYVNSRENSYVRDGSLFLRPTLTTEMPGNQIGDALLTQGKFDLWGGAPADSCTGNRDYGCLRVGTPENLVNPIRSARLRTAESFNFQFGRIEVRARLPAGDWLWPAIWLLPVNNEYGDWPASGEIDIMESRGNRELNADGLGPSTILSTLHWGPASIENAFKLTSSSLQSLPKGIDYSENFHIFGLYWDSTGLYSYVDDDSNRVLKVKFDQPFFDRARKGGINFDNNPWNNSAKFPNAAPFDRKFYILLNVAVGGTSGFFDDSTPGKPWKDHSPTAVRDFWAAKSAWWPTWNAGGSKEARALVVDSIKVWSIDEPDQNLEKNQPPTKGRKLGETPPSSIVNEFNESNFSNFLVTISAFASILAAVSILIAIVKICSVKKSTKDESKEMKLIDTKSTEVQP